MTLREIQEAVVKEYNITLNENSTCRRRMHAHVKQRMVCKWHPKSPLEATFELFHEIGHIETTTSSMRRCEAEYHATVWAMDRFREYGLTVPPRMLGRYQEYIWRELDRGLRRHGKNLPTKEELTLHGFKMIVRA